MFPATRIVAPNSPSERAKARRRPAAIPREAKGSVTVERTRTSLAPSVRATASRRGFTSSKATRAVRTRRGRDITIMATTTAFHVKTTSTPKRLRAARPPGPRRPRNFRSRRPVATGGRTSGSETSVSRRALPGKRLRARSNASASPKGARRRTARAATRSVNQTTGTSTASSNTSVLHEEAVSHEDGARGGSTEVREEAQGLLFPWRPLDERERIRDRRAQGRGDLERNPDLPRNRGIGPVDDSGVDVPRLDGRERRPHVLGRHDFPGERVPDSDSFEEFLRVDARGDGRRLRQCELLDALAGEILRRGDLERTVVRHEDAESVGRDAATGPGRDEVCPLEDVHLRLVCREE